MEKKVCFAFYTTDAHIAVQIEALLTVWAEELCLRLQIKRLFSLLDRPEPSCALLLVDDCGLNRERLLQLQRLRERRAVCGLVLITADEQVAIHSYQCHPNAMVPKPMTYAGLKAAMQRCFSCWNQALQWLDLPLQHRRLRIPLYYLLYAEAAGRNAVLYCIGEQMQVNCSLSALESMLPHPPFVRCQKSFVVHLAAVRRMENGRLIMSDDRVISVTRTRLRQVQKEWMEYQAARSAGEAAE